MSAHPTFARALSITTRTREPNLIVSHLLRIVCRTFIYVYWFEIESLSMCQRRISLHQNQDQRFIWLSSKFPKSTHFFFFLLVLYRSYRSYQYRFFPTFLYNKETACHGRVCSVGLPTSGKLVGLSLAICWDRYMYCFIFKKKKEMKTSTFEASFVPVTVMEIASLHTYLWVNTPYHPATQQYYFISGGLVHREGL